MNRFLVRVLNKLRLLPRLSVFTKVRLLGSEFRVPVVNRIGLPNIFPKIDWLSDLLKTLRINDHTVFLDVGANIGQTVLQVKAISPEIRYIAFEPNSVCVVYLNHLVELNGLRNTTIVPVGLGDQPALQMLNKLSATDSGASVVETGGMGIKEVIPVFSLDSIFRELDLNPGKVIMKIDVEGYELEALRGMRKFLEEVRPVIIIEILDALRQSDLNNKTERNNAVLTFLSSLRYLAYRLLKNPEVTRVQALEEVAEIATVVMNKEKYNLHDYLFVPRETEPPKIGQL